MFQRAWQAVSRSLFLFTTPIFWIDVVTSSRRARYFWTRAIYACALFLLLWSSYSSNIRTEPATLEQLARFASSFFWGFAFLQLVAVVLLTPAMVAGTIATERERRTLEYLFATDLSNREIVLGKLASRLLHLTGFLLVALHILSLARLFGGISLDDLVMASLIAGSSMLVTASIALLQSVRAARARDAVIHTYSTLLGLLLVPLLLELFLRFMVFRNSPKINLLVEWLRWSCAEINQANPFYFLATIGTQSNAGLTAGWLEVWAPVRTHLVASVICLLLSVLLLRRDYGRAATAVSKKGTPWRLWRRRAIGNLSPMLWKELYAEQSPGTRGRVMNVLQFLLIVAIVAGTLWMFRMSRANQPSLRGQEFIGYAAVIGTLISAAVLVGITAQAAASVTSERERETWLSVLGTPITGAEVFWAKLAGSLYRVRWLCLTLGFIWALCCVNHPPFVGNMILLIGTLALLATCFGSLGVLLSIRFQTSLRAMATAVSIAIFAGGGYLFCCIPLMFAGSGDAEIMFAPCVLFLLAFPNIIVFESPPAEIGAAYVLGIVGYLVATGVVISVAIANFDAWNGRVTTGGLPPRPYRPPLPKRMPEPGQHSDSEPGNH